MQAAARAAGLEYRHLPVDGAYQSPEQIAAFAVAAAGTAAAPAGLLPLGCAVHAPVPGRTALNLAGASTTAWLDIQAVFRPCPLESRGDNDLKALLKLSAFIDAVNE
jgi:hypothetical protein